MISPRQVVHFPTPSTDACVTHHAMARYREYYPAAEDSDVLAALERSTHIEDRGLALALFGLGWLRDDDRAEYHLHPERTGVFVVGSDGVLIAFKRFYAKKQHDLTVKWFGPGEPCTSSQIAYLKVTGQPTYSDGPTEEDDLLDKIRVSDGACKRLGSRAAVKQYLRENRDLIRESTDAERAANPLVDAPCAIDLPDSVLLIGFSDERVQVYAATTTPPKNLRLPTPEPLAAPASSPTVIPWLSDYPLRLLRIPAATLQRLPLSGSNKSRLKLIRAAFCALEPPPEVDPRGTRITLHLDGNLVPMSLYVQNFRPHNPDPEWAISDRLQRISDEEVALIERLAALGWVSRRDNPGGTP